MAMFACIQGSCSSATYFPKPISTSWKQVQSVQCCISNKYIRLLRHFCFPNFHLSYLWPSSSWSHGEFTNIHLSIRGFWGRWTGASTGSWHQNRLQRGISILSDRFSVDLRHFWLYRKKCGLRVKMMKVVLKRSRVGEEEKGEVNMMLLISEHVFFSLFFLIFSFETMRSFFFAVCLYSLVELLKQWLPFPGHLVNLMKAVSAR